MKASPLRCLIAALLLLTCSCNKEHWYDTGLSVTAEKVTPKQALIAGTALLPEDINPMQCEIGILVALENHADAPADKYVCTSRENSRFSVLLKHLECGTKYYIRPYVKYNGETYLGGFSSFTTEPLPAHAVDLGLDSDLLWADCNAGGSSPESLGEAYAYGETAPKKDYSAATYVFFRNYSPCRQIDITKYVIADGAGDEYWYNADGEFTGDGKNLLDSEDDAAAAAMGDGWRLPTIQEFKDLKRECTTTIENNGGFNGLRFKSSNGSEILLPCSWQKTGTSEYVAKGLGMYRTLQMWTGSQTVSTPASSELSTVLYFSAKNSSSSEVGTYTEYPMSRYRGYPARGVYDCSIEPAELPEFKGTQKVEKSVLPEITDEPAALVKYGDDSVRLTIDNSKCKAAVLDGKACSYFSADAIGGPMYNFKNSDVLISVYFNDIAGCREGDELVPLRALFGFTSSSSTSAVTDRYYGNIRLLSRTEDSVVLRFEKVMITLFSDKFVLNGTIEYRTI